MSNYLPRTRKKRDRQERLEDDLRRLIAQGADLTKLIAAAEAVRAARIRTVRADRQHCWEIGSTGRYDAEIAALQTAPVETILAEFGARFGGRADAGGASGDAGAAPAEPGAADVT